MQNQVALPALKSNYLIFDIFSFLKFKVALLTMRILSKKCFKFSEMLETQYQGKHNSYITLKLDLNESLNVLASSYLKLFSQIPIRIIFNANFFYRLENIKELETAISYLS